MTSSLGLNNILYAAAVVYLDAKDKSCRKISSITFVFDVNSEICRSQIKPIAINI